MKILNLEKFRALPENTLFSKFIPCAFDYLEIKGDTIECDFWTQEIHSAIECNDSGQSSELLFEAQEKGLSLKMDFECEGRDGLYEDNQLFAVWENNDLLQLIDRLKQCIKAE